MIFLEHASYSQETIRDNFGAPEYSYHFVRHAFRQVLDRLGRRVNVDDPRREVDPLFRSAMQAGEDCLYLSFNPPQKTILELSCPTLPIFAWEYDTVPTETWNAEPRNDWRYVFSRTGMAVSLSRLSADAVRLAMGESFPVWAIPSPMFDAYARPNMKASGWRQPFDLRLDGALAMSVGDLDLSIFRPGRPQEGAHRMLRALDHAALDPNRPPQVFRISGVTYSAVLCPADGRKNWRDLVTGFVWAFRDTPSATLLLKLTHANVEDGLMPVLRRISTLGDFSCRIILINGLLSNEAYAGLIDASSYVVNTARAEGQCLPLTEYMSAGRPAVAPAHTAMLDYLRPDNAFIVPSWQEPARWPQDERLVMRCRDNQISFFGLVQQYRESYRVARDEPKRFARMSEAAIETMRNFCSNEVVAGQFAEVLKHVRAAAKVRAALQ